MASGQATVDAARVYGSNSPEEHVMTSAPISQCERSRQSKWANITAVVIVMVTAQILCGINRYVSGHFVHSLGDSSAPKTALLVHIELMRFLDTP